MNSNKLTILLGVAIVFSALFLFYNLNTPIKPAVVKKPIEPAKPNITINGHTFTLELAKTSLEQQKGLSDRNSLPIDHGMLFMFNQKISISFWMKDMRFPIDIIFMDDEKVINVVHNAPVPNEGDTDLPRYKPDEPIDKALEINAGLSEKYNIKKGDKVKISY